ncbi:SDR family oxidoreductase [Glycomyces xiaoerkulensis]|uniref:SDR family oxidoreductase n=1 Tax=Glycomyces xiaoerkulensis TaxID=2038139 RepID=UPI000C26A001
MTDKIALITGSNKGIGLEVARGLGRKGMTVLVGARSAERGEAAAETLRGEGLQTEFLGLDVTDPDSIAEAAARVEERYGRLDVLVNNAGIAKGDGDGNTSELTLATAKEVFEVNVFGVMAVTNAFLPLLRKSEAARIVNVSSEVGSMATITSSNSPILGHQPGAYGTSKAALNMLTVSYSLEFRGTTTKVNAVTPGFTATDLNGHRGVREASDAAQVAIDMALIGEDGPSGEFRSDGRIEYLEGETVPW